MDVEVEMEGAAGEELKAWQHRMEGLMSTIQVPS